MARLDFVEKNYIEQLFKMESGYVLDFSNRTFQEFIYDILQIDIYLKYEGLSKAKILRRIITEYDNVVVGKLLLELLRHMKSKNLVSESERQTFKKCAEIGNRLIGRAVAVKMPIENNIKTNPIESIIDYDYLTTLLNLQIILIHLSQEVLHSKNI